MGTLSPQNSNRAQGKSTKELSTLMQDVLARAKEKGATDAFVSLNHDNGFSVDVRMGDVENVSFNEDKGISLTIYIDHHKGSASSTDTSSDALDAMVAAAYDIAMVSASDSCFGLRDKELMVAQYPDLDLFHPWPISPPEAIELALACEKRALARDKRISNSDGVNIATYEFCQGFANTYGGEGILRSTIHNVSSSLIAKEGDSMKRDYDYTTARAPEGLMSLDELADSVAERTVSRLGARQLKTGKVPVLFSSRISSSLFSAFIGAISGSSIYRKNSFLLDAVGQQIFPANIQIHEQPHLLGALGSAAFDNEGVPTRNNVFVKDGTLQQYVLSSYSARRLGLKTTANCGGVFNLTIDPTAGDLKSLLKTMDKGLLVTELMGQGVNGLTGDYSRGASGFWVENGEIQYPVEEITIAGNLKEMFRAIAAIGNDINPRVAARCGSVLIDQMVVAGS